MKTEPVHHSESLSPEETSSRAIAWALGKGEGDWVIETARGHHRRRRRLRLAMAVAGLALVVGAAALRFRAEVPQGMPVQSTVALLVPEQQRLSDGSAVQLRDGAVFTALFGPDIRKVELRAGEAHFEVAPDPKRPFVVVAGSVEIRAIGTAFTVRHGAETVDVLVTDGRVAVEKHIPADTPTAAAPSESVQAVDVGGSVVVGLTPNTTEVPKPVATTEPEQKQRLGWRVPRLKFSGTPLGDAVAQFNSHGKTRLVLAHGLSSIQLSGTVRVDDVASLLALLHDEFGIEGHERPTGEIDLTKP